MVSQVIVKAADNHVSIAIVAPISSEPSLTVSYHFFWAREEATDETKPISAHANKSAHVLITAVPAINGDKIITATTSEIAITRAVEASIRASKFLSDQSNIPLFPLMS
jgi:hypothetical protein